MDWGALGIIVSVVLFGLAHIGTAIFVFGRLTTTVKSLQVDGVQLRDEIKGLRQDMGRLDRSLARLEGKVNGHALAGSG